MKSKQAKKVKDQMGPFLQEGEEVRAVMFARPRGWGMSEVASPAIGDRQQRKAYEGAERAGIRLGSPGALVLTNQRLLTVETGEALGMGLGVGGSVKEVLSAVPVTEVDSIKLRRLPLAYIVTLTVRGSEFKLDTNALRDAKLMAQELERGKAEAQEPR